MTLTGKIGSRGQVTLPKEVRRRFKLEPGQDVAFVIKGDALTIIPLTKTLFDWLNMRFKGIEEAQVKKAVTPYLFF